MREREGGSEREREGKGGSDNGRLLNGEGEER